MMIFEYLIKFKQFLKLKKDHSKSGLNILNKN